MKKPRAQIARRDFLKLAGIAALNVFLLAVGRAGYRYLMEHQAFRVETIRLKLSRLPRRFSGLRLVQISDIHMGGWMNPARLQHVADLIIEQKPELLLITGDFVIGRKAIDRSSQIAKDLTLGLSPLAAAFPTFAVLGNHDYWTDVQTVRHVLAASGITELTNAVFTLQRGGESLYLCGVDDVGEGHARIDHVISQIRKESAAILLAHEPDFADISAATGRFDLQLSGHSHGGQIVLPLIGPPVLPRLGRKYPSGLYKVRDMFQYTNRGVGTGRLSLRVNCPPEITVFILESLRS